MKRTLTRRGLGQAALATAALSHTESKEGIADANETTELSGLDPVRWTLEQYESAPLQLTFKAKTKAEAEAWQKQLRAKLVELLGGFPQKTPLKAQTLAVRDFPTYRREKFAFES